MTEISTRRPRGLPLRGRGSRAATAPRTRRQRRQERAAYLFLAPWLIGLVVLWIGPIIASFVLSFTNWSLIGKPSFAGLSNYSDMLHDYAFWQSIKVTLLYMALSVPIYMAAGLGLSLLLNQRFRGMNVFRTIFFIPSVLSGVAVAILWASLLNPDVGAVNWVLRLVGISDPPRWLGDPSWAVPSVVLVGLWSVGGGAIIYLSGLQNIPEQLYEAARLDGAGPLQRFRFVTWPMLTPTLLFVLLTSMIEAFQVFDIAYVLGGSSGSGAVGDSMRFYLINMWNEGFQNSRMGYASALAWVLILIAGVIILAIFRTSGRWVYYEYEPDRN